SRRARAGASLLPYTTLFRSVRRRSAADHRDRPRPGWDGKRAPDRPIGACSARGPPRRGVPEPSRRSPAISRVGGSSSLRGAGDAEACLRDRFETGGLDHGLAALTDAIAPGVHPLEGGIDLLQGLLVDLAEGVGDIVLFGCFIELGLACVTRRLQLLTQTRE